MGPPDPHCQLPGHVQPAPTRTQVGLCPQAESPWARRRRRCRYPRGRQNGSRHPGRQSCPAAVVASRQLHRTVGWSRQLRAARRWPEAASPAGPACPAARQAAPLGPAVPADRQWSPGVRAVFPPPRRPHTRPAHVTAQPSTRACRQFAETGLTSCLAQDVSALRGRPLALQTRRAGWPVLPGGHIELAVAERSPTAKRAFFGCRPAPKELSGRRPTKLINSASWAAAETFGAYSGSCGQPAPPRRHEPERSRPHADVEHLRPGGRAEVGPESGQQLGWMSLTLRQSRRRRCGGQVSVVVTVPVDHADVLRHPRPGPVPWIYGPHFGR